MRIFPFGLNDKAKAWLKAEPTGIYRTSEQLDNGFFANFYPPCKSSLILIQTFKQQPFKYLYGAWERLKPLNELALSPDFQLVSCPVLLWRTVEYKSSTNAACGRDMVSKLPRTS